MSFPKTQTVNANGFTVFLLLVSCVVTGVRCEIGSQVGLSIFNTLLDLPFQIFNFVTQNAEVIAEIVKGQPPITTEKLISSQGYRPETHEVTTEDGYILKIHRVIQENGRYRNASSFHGSPVILLHGIGQSSAEWVLPGQQGDSLGFSLVDRGFDVWLANQRGTPYSRHATLNSDSKEFWDFSTHEVGFYDLPAITDYVLRLTKHKQVNFVGFSQGAAAFLVLNAKKPEYNSKFSRAIFMAPGFIYYNGFYYGLSQLEAPFTLEILEGLRGLLGSAPLLSPTIAHFLHWVLPGVCSPNVDLLGICMGLFKLHFGDDHGLISQEKLSTALSVFPVPVGLRTLVHIKQQMKYTEFTEFDFGATRNRQLYDGSGTPPIYNLTNVNSPVAILVGGGDIIGSPTDARTLAKKLPNLLEYHEVDHPHFTHPDFILADSVGKLVYSKVIRILEKFNS